MAVRGLSGDRDHAIVYQLRLPTFEGPLDLLLQLIERHQMDITTVSLAAVTDQYMEHLRTGAGIDPEQLSEFVAVASKLLLIKSLALLPRPPRARPDEPPLDPTDLTERLREYEAIKRAALALKSREEADLRSYPHVAFAEPAPAGRNGHAANGWLASQLELFAPPDTQERRERSPLPVAGLLAAFRRATTRRREAPVEVARETWTVADAVAWLIDAAWRGAASFRRLAAGFGRARLVCAFLAMLELHRQGKLIARQAAPYSDIELAPVRVEAEAPAEGRT